MLEIVGYGSTSALSVVPLTMHVQAKGQGPIYRLHLEVLQIFHPCSGKSVILEPCYQT
jgi:hypothetical protein